MHHQRYCNGRIACFLLLFSAAADLHAVTTAVDDSLLSEAMVLERYGRLDVSPEALQMLAEELAPNATASVLGGTIRYVGPGCPFTTIQSAINASGDGDTVRVLTGSYNGAVSIQSKSINLVGGFPNCSAFSPTGRSTINRGGSGLGVDIFYPAGTADATRTVNIENFVIRGGGGTGFSSGGILVEGRPGKLAVNFRNVQISDNRRDGAGVDGNGGGLRIVTTGDASGGGAMVTLDNASTVLRNTAGGDGGGVHCRSTHDNGTVTLLRMGSTLVFDNEAVNGGGVMVDGCKNVFLYNGGPFVLFFPTGGILGNTASNTGGGIAVRNGGDVWMRAVGFAGFGDPDEAALISGNDAGIGGAADVRGVDSRLRVEDAYTIGNSAGVGGAFNVILEGRLEVFRRAGTAACAPVASGGGVLSRPPCSVIEDNDAISSGGALSITGASSADISRSFIRNNRVVTGVNGTVVGILNPSFNDGPNTQVRIEASVIHDNTGGFDFDVANNADLIISHSTLADNPSTLVRVSTDTDRFARARIVSSIIDSPVSGIGVLQGVGDNRFELDCVISNVDLAQTGATFSAFYSQIDPEFIDQDARDYRLRATSPAIDYCDGFSPALFPDLEGNPRGVAWAGPTTTVPPNSFPGGLVDLGAYEIPFQVLNTDLAVETNPPGQRNVFINNGESIAISLTLTNNGPNIAFGEIDVIDDFTSGAVVNESWTCTPPAGVTCTPAAGSGDIQTAISNLQPGQQVNFSRNANLAQPGTDQNFQYIIIAAESVFNIDLNAGNNTLQLEVETGLFADGFE